MAIALLKVKEGKKGNAVSHSDYIAREGKYVGYDKTEKMEDKGHGNMPTWATNNPQYFWQMSDSHERKNGTSYREHIVALPRELSKEERGELVQDWIKSEVGEKQAYQYAIHNKIGMDGNEQPHLHLMINEREQDGIQRDPNQYFKRYNSKNPDRGGCKKVNTGLGYSERKQNLKEQRQRWENLCNKHLERAGLEERIDMSKGKGGRHIPYEQMKKLEVEKAYREELKLRKERLEIGKEFTDKERFIGFKELEQMKLEEVEKESPSPSIPIKRESKKEQKEISNPQMEGQTPDEAREYVAMYEQAIAVLAEKIRKEKTNELKKELNSVAKQYNDLAKKGDGIGGMAKKMFGGKSERDKQLDSLALEHSMIKRNIAHTEKRDYSVEAQERMEEQQPHVHERRQQAMETLEYEANYKYGSREVMSGRQYTGEITRVSRFGVIQKSFTGKQYHHELKNLDKVPKVGEKVRITYDGDKQAEVQTADRFEVARQQQQAELERQQKNDRGFER